jgi:hypothetical protein
MLVCIICLEICPCVIMYIFWECHKMLYSTPMQILNSLPYLPVFKGAITFLQHSLKEPCIIVADCQRMMSWTSLLCFLLCALYHYIGVSWAHRLIQPECQVLRWSLGCWTFNPFRGQQICLNSFNSYIQTHFDIKRVCECHLPSLCHAERTPNKAI